ncbi:hypothetical protein ASPWEDRAFT_32022 [Aspergillus wentii DTO 134E9]|uniref:TLC domain-containing protein n=1 Tax=Aspergillus wentii DTO 134E9 TaxID=1073089 RepID=A0A1L9R920_ASPWE|nr:uncharacterized protein ASPWEDRAFT_32022 [Aspergillus wentii DTO 134E9]KAI9926572.1 hypothetical protein MW887_004340 [Aspergillus wentii]OJJ31378.1 hypothetical protein ASPWEDRAFT_32022 [Aspergillus wentii DTO 134E9]
MNIFTRHGHYLQNKPLESISKLAPFSGLIISIILVILFLIRFYILEGFLIRRLYGTIFTDMNELNRRGFINHHIAGTTKIIILIIAAYPFICVTFGKSTFHTPFVEDSPVTMGDVLIIVAQMLIAMYIFELLYRVKLSPVAVMHHVGTILIGQSAIAISLRLAREPDADIEFILCTVWGAFDIISEFFPHVAIVLYRVFPTRHRFLARVFILSCITTATGTLCETIVTMWLFGSLWNKWEIAFKVATPLLHIAFSAAQIHGSLVFWRMYRRQQRYMKEGILDAESAKVDKAENVDGGDREASSTASNIGMVQSVPRVVSV